ncbi:MAG: type VI secretion system baseplate subunit TssK [Pseudomonadota bacterium]
MIPTAKVLWGEGLFIRPQHFQRQDSYHEWRLAQAMTIVHPYAWGVRNVKIDMDALKAGRLRLLELQLVLPDGEFYNAPAEDDLPEPLTLGPIFEQDSEMVFHAVVAPVRSNGSNLASTQADDDESARYFQVEHEAADQFTQAASAHISVLGKSLRLVPDHEPRGHLVGLPLVRLRRNASGGFETDPRFIAPSTSIAASQVMFLHMRRLLDVLQAKVEALYGYHREPSKNIIEFRSGDVASFWLLHTASSAYAALSHLLRHPQLHPERLFQQLLELAGALMTFSKTFTLADLPAYEHGNPGPSFFRLNHILRELLETVISTRYFGIALEEVRPSFYQGRLDAQQISEATTLYLGVSATLQPSELVESIPQRVKVGSPEDVEKLVLSALGGVTVTHAPQVPAAIPVRPGSYYFALEPRGMLYERMLRAQAISLYVPQGIPDLKLELIAINP